MNWRAVFAAATGVVLFAALNVLRHRDDNVAVSNAAPEQPGYYLKDATLIQTDANTGAPAWRLHAVAIARDPRNESIRLEQVRLDYLTSAETPWLLTAQRGYVPQDSRVVKFTGAVHIEPQGAQSTPMSLQTEELSIDTQRNQATAPGKVTINMNQQQLTAVGLKADLQNQKVRLLSQVHGEFQALPGKTAGKIQ